MDFQAGRISYRNAAGETGREWFEMVRHAGGRILRAFCEMDDMDLSRDVSIALDLQHRPQDAFVRVIKGGRVTGTTLFLLEQGELHCQGRIQGLGAIDQRVALSRPLGYLGLHPLVGDALIACARGTSDPGSYLPIACHTNSQSPAGDEGLTAIPVTIDVAYLGEEALEVEAGHYIARGYALRWKPEWAPARLWVHGEDALFLKLDWPMLGLSYELVEHQTRR
jgi:hypothetical protein